MIGDQVKEKGLELEERSEGAEFQNGNCWYTPGSFRKSGKQRSHGIRNLEECATHRK